MCKKRSAQGAFSDRFLLRSGDGVQLLCELRLFIRRVVLVQKALGASGIDGGNGLGIELVRRLLIACADRRQKLLDLRFESGLQRLVLRCFLLGDKNALFCGFNVRHDGSP